MERPGKSVWNRRPSRCSRLWERRHVERPENSVCNQKPFLLLGGRAGVWMSREFFLELTAF